MFRKGGEGGIELVGALEIETRTTAGGDAALGVGEELLGEVALAGLAAAFDGEEPEAGAAGDEFGEREAGFIVVGERPLQGVNALRPVGDGGWCGGDAREGRLGIGGGRAGGGYACDGGEDGRFGFSASVVRRK